MRGRKERWNLRVLAPKGKARRQLSRDEMSRQAAALFIPEEFADFPLVAEVVGPIKRQGSKLVIVRAELPLERAVAAVPKSGSELNFQLALILEHDDGLHKKIECRYETPEGESIHVPLGKRRRARGGHLLLELACPAPHEGEHIARVVVTNTQTDEIGATRASVDEDAATDTPTVSTSFRLASPRDLIWRSNFDAAQRNSSLAFWRVPTELTHAEPDDRIAIDFRYCGPDTKVEPSWYALMTTSANGEIRLESVFRPHDGSIRSTRQGPCRSDRIELAEFSLPSATYALLAFADEAACARFAKTLTPETTLTPESGVLSWRAFHVGE